MIIINEFYKLGSNTQIVYIIYINHTIFNFTIGRPSSNRNEPTLHQCSAFTQPVYITGLHGDSHVDTGQTGPPDRSDRYQQNREAAHSAHGCATRQPSSLGVSLHHLPPLCISADKFDAAGAEIDVLVPCNKNLWQQTLSILILSKAYPTSGYSQPTYLDM